MTHQSTAPAPIIPPAFVWSSQIEQQMQAEAEPSTAPAPGATPPAPTAPGTAPAAPAAPTGTVPAATPPQFTPEQTQERIRELNEEARTHREAREAAEARATAAEARSNAILAAAGFTPQGTTAPPTPEALQQQLSEQNATAERLARENAVIRIGTRPDVSANVDRLLDSASFTSEIASIAATDTAGLERVIRERVEKDASYKAIIPAASGGSTVATGAGAAPTSRKPRAEALAARLGSK